MKLAFFFSFVELGFEVCPISMARLNVRNFRFQLSLSFIAFGVITLAVVLTTVFTLSAILSRGIHMMQVEQPSQMWLAKLRGHVQGANSHMQHYFDTGNEDHVLLSKKLLNKEIPFAIDRMVTYYPDWLEAEYKVMWEEIAFDLSRMESLWDKMEMAETLEIRKGLYAEQGYRIQSKLDKEINVLYDVLQNNVVTTADGLFGKIDRFFVFGGIRFLILVLVIVVLFRLLNRRLSKMIARVQEPISVLSQGNLPDQVATSDDEMQEVLKEVALLSENLRTVKNFALEVGKGNFDTNLAAFDNAGEIGLSLGEMKESLRKVDEQDKQRDWVNSGFNKFGELIRRYGDNLEVLTQELVKNLVEFLDINQGGFFVVAKSEMSDEQTLQLKAAYAYERQKFEDKEVVFGEGLLGQAWQEKDLVVLDKLPVNYMHITSGLGYATPHHLVLVPLVANDEVYGMLELASFSGLAGYQLEFLRGLGESLATAINTVKVNDNTRRLLDESQELTEQMRSQEEEMRQNMEELQATQEEMKRSANESEQKMNRLNTILNSTADPVITVASNGIIDAFNYAAEALFGYNASEVINHNIGLLLPEEKVIRRELVESSNSPVERAKVKTRRSMEAIRKGGKRFLAEVAIKETFYDGQKYFTVLVRDISHETEALQDLEHDNKKLKLELEVVTADRDRVEKMQREIRLRHAALDRSVLLLDLTEDGTISYANELLVNSLESSVENVVGKSFKEVLFTLDNASAFNYFWKQVMKSDEILQQDLQMRSEGDSKVWVRCTFSKVLDEDKEVNKVLVIAQDISQQMHLLNQTQQEIRRLHSASVPQASGLDAETAEKLETLKSLQEEVRTNLLGILKDNEARMKDAIGLQQDRWKMK